MEYIYLLKYEIYIYTKKIYSTKRIILFFVFISGLFNCIFSCLFWLRIS